MPAVGFRPPASAVPVPPEARFHTEQNIRQTHRLRSFSRLPGSQLSADWYSIIQEISMGRELQIMQSYRRSYPEYYTDYFCGNWRRMTAPVLWKRNLRNTSFDPVRSSASRKVCNYDKKRNTRHRAVRFLRWTRFLFFFVISLLSL